MVAHAEIMSWAIGIQALVLVLALAGRMGYLTHSQAISPPEQFEALLVPITEIQAEAMEATAPTETAIEPVAPAELSISEDSLALPEIVETLSPPDFESPPLDAILEALPAPDPILAERPQPLTPVKPGVKPPVGSSGSPKSLSAARADAPPSSGSAVPSAMATGQAKLFSGAGTGRFPLPPYPAEAKRRGIEGRVMLSLHVASDGKPGQPQIETSSGHASLDRAAMDWIKRRWRWEAGPPRHFRIPIHFQLQ